MSQQTPTMSPSFQNHQNHSSSARNNQEFKPVLGSYNNNKSNTSVTKNNQYNSGSGNTIKQQNIENQSGGTNIW
ncbi:hypothetical protein SUGI_1103950 [Cryptomeria japonica]|nr:hypothetical protein SUGI_1103950 [Cryptomeria japonica]